MGQSKVQFTSQESEATHTKAHRTTKKARESKEAEQSDKDDDEDVKLLGYKKGEFPDVQLESEMTKAELTPAKEVSDDVDEEISEKEVEDDENAIGELEKMADYALADKHATPETNKEASEPNPPPNHDK